MIMMRIVATWLMILTFLSMTFPLRVEHSSREKGQDKQVLIVYLSRTKNTEAVAKIIHKKVGGDMVALELVSPYPENYQGIVAQVAEENETGFLPPLKTVIDNIGKYDMIFVGFPTWGM